MENEFYSPEVEYAIADYLREIDAKNNSIDFFPLLFSGGFRNMFGDINFAGLETIFRKFSFNTHCLAVPEELVDQEFMGIVAVNANDAEVIYGDTLRPMMETLREVRRVSHITIFCPDRQTAEFEASYWGLSYDPLINLTNLRNSGVMVPKPGTPFARQVSGMLGNN